MQALLEAFNALAHKRQEDLQFLERANFTSDEEAMGITPSAFNMLNSKRDPPPLGRKKSVSLAAGTKLGNLTPTIVHQENESADDSAGSITIEK